MDKLREKIFKKSQGSDGLISTKEIEALGIGKYNIKKFMEDGFLVREAKGIYSIAKEIADEYAVLCKRSQKAVYSYATALFFHNLSDRVPRVIDITLPQGYNAGRLKKANANLRIHYVKPEILTLGMEKIRTPLGSIVKAYNSERCICDIIKNRTKIDKQIFTQAIKTYFTHEYNPLDILKVAKKIGVESEVRKYMEVL